MLIECAYSFADLHRAAFGRLPSAEEQRRFSALSQPQRNELVRDWARKAGWETRDKTGSDGQLYAAFAPSFRLAPKNRPPACSARNGV